MAIEGLRTNPDYKLESTYLIMNNKTYDSLRDLVKDEYAPIIDMRVYSQTSTFPQYRGIKIAICDALDYGEIDIVRGYRC